MEEAENTIIEDHRFPCQECGADLRYDPSQGALVCNHCGHKEEIIAPPRGWELQEMDLRAALANQLKDESYLSTRTAHCDNCGAVIEFSPDDHATECAYCASPIVIDTGMQRQLKPRGVVPFAIDEATAHDFLGRWLGRLWFAPNGLSQFARKGRKLNAVYIPYWTFDAETETQYTGNRGDVYHETVGYGQNRRHVTKVRWSPARGRVGRFFDDVLILASRALPKSYTDEIAPFDLAHLEPYNPEFLAGYRAEAYSIDLENGWKEAQEVMKQVIIRDIKFDIGGDRQQIHQMQTQLGRLGFKHVLLPIYTLAYKFRGKTFRCVINGQTGRISGERPYSIWKIFFAVLLFVLFTFLMMMMAQQNGHIQFQTY